MIRIAAFEVRDDEMEYFKQCGKIYDCEIVTSPNTLTEDLIDNLKDITGVTTTGHSSIDKAVIDKLIASDIKLYATRTMGYDHVDVKYAKEAGLKVANSNYPPSGVADYTVMLILMSLRHYKKALWRGQVNDYSLEGLVGKDLHELTVGVIGTGRIGQSVINRLTGFGCNIIAYDKYWDETVKNHAAYVELEELMQTSDIITLHTPLLEDTYHMINTESIGKMKKGVVLINCARGELMDVDSLIEGIESRQIGALAMDVIEGEQDIYHKDRKDEIICNPKMAYLRQFPNVVMTQHMAFYTELAVKNMVFGAVSGICDMKKHGTCETEL